MKTIELLRSLQATDSALDADRTTLTQVEAELGDRSALVAARATRDSLAKELRAVESDQRDLELEVERLREQLRAIEGKMYGGKVGDAKELSNLGRESTQSRGLISSREDRLLELFERVDAASAALAAAESALQGMETERSARETHLAAERQRLNGAIESGEASRESLRGQAEASVLRTYDNLRRTRGGLAVVEARQRTCQGCRIGMTISEEMRARLGDQLVFCQSCGRFLFATT